MSDKPNPIDLIDSLSISGGEPQEVTINGADLRIRRDYTGQQVKAFMDDHLTENAKDNLRDQLSVVLGHLDADNDEDSRAAFREEILQRTIPEVTQIVKKLGVIAGLRGRDGNFLTGARF